MEKSTLELEIINSYLLHKQHPTDDILRDNFNALQMLYKAQYDTYYRFSVVAGRE